jgi:hypothetical protein
MAFSGHWKQMLLFFVVLFGTETMHAQSENPGPRLTALPGRTVSPLQSHYFLIRLHADVFMSSRTPTAIGITVPYTHRITGVRDTFQGTAFVSARAAEPRVRINAGIEFQLGWSPAVVVDFSFSPEKGIFGRFNNLSYLKYGVCYNFGMMQEKNVSKLSLRPGLFMIYHEDNYLAGYAPSEKIRFAGYDFEGGGNDSIPVGYASMNNLLRANIGLWFLPKYGRKLNVAPWIVIPAVSFRLEIGYDLKVWSRERISVGSGGAYRNIGKEGVVSAPAPSALKNVHRYDGFSVSVGIVFRPYGRKRS